jgi:hypothetical protein
VQRNKSFLVVCVSIVITGIAAAQNAQRTPSVVQDARFVPPAASSFAEHALPAHLMLTPPIPVSGLWMARAGSFQSSIAAGSTGSHPGPTSLADDYYSRHFGFFCKRELELEKTIHVPLRFRLGSLENCNRLEGK